MPRNPVPTRDPSRKRAFSVLFLVVLFAASGCNSLGSRPPSEPGEDNGFLGWHFHAPFDTSEVKTVFVYFKTQTLHRDLQLQLIEAVQKEISKRTPYRVVGNPEQADSILSGTIIYANRNLIVEAPTNLPRELNASMSVTLDWTHNPPTEAESKRGPTTVAETVNFIPEVGETTSSAYIRAITSIAQQIVDMMEVPWFNDDDVR